jgi:hypothetical protein
MICIDLKTRERTPILSEPENPRERWLSLRLLDYWRDICGENDFPRVADIDSSAIDDMWDYCFIIDLTSGTPKFSHFGGWHADFYGADMTGRALADLDRGTLAERSTDYLAEVLQRKLPITYGNDLTEPGGRRILYRSIMMPLSDDGETLSGVFGGSNCKTADDSDEA